MKNRTVVGNIAVVIGAGLLVAACGSFGRGDTRLCPRVSLLNEALSAVRYRDGPGRDLILSGLEPVLDGVEDFVSQAQPGTVREGLPVRAALMQITTAATVRAASGTQLREPLWGAVDAIPRLARLLVLDQGP